MGSTASGFAAGFTESLVKGIQASRDRKQAEQDRAAQQALSLVNLAIQSGVSPADIPQSVWDAVAPDYAKGAGKKRPPLGQVIGGVLNSVKGSGGQPDTSGAIGGGYFGQGGIEPLWHHGPGTQAPAQGGPGTPIPLSPLPGTATPPGGAGTAGGAAPPAGEAPQQAVTPSPASPAAPGASETPRIGPFGIPFLTPEQRATKEAETQNRLLVRQIQVARDTVLPALRAVDPKATMRDALSAMGLHVPTTPSGSTSVRYGGIIKGDQIGEGEKDAYDRPIDPNGSYRVEIQPSGDFTYIPTVTPTAGTNAGTAYTQAAISMGYGSVAEVPKDRRPELEAKAKEITQGLSSSRALGTGEGRFQSPTNIAEAQAGGVPVGTSAAEVAGQRVPTSAQTTRRQSIESLKGTLDHIKSDLLSPLPKADDAEVKAGVPPGAITFMRRRLPSYREQFAKLDAAVNDIVNVVARSVAEQRGTQTERDAERAEAAVVQLRDAVTGGDTQESASARIDESLKILDGILKQLPEVPKARTAGSSPAKAPTVQYTTGTSPDGGYYISDGTKTLYFTKDEHGAYERAKMRLGIK